MAFSCGGNPAAKDDYRFFLPLGKEKKAGQRHFRYHLIVGAYRTLRRLSPVRQVSQVVPSAHGTLCHD
jgi:hypothetical protein